MYLVFVLLWHDFRGGSDDKGSATKWETQVRSLGWEDPLEKEMASKATGISLVESDKWALLC